MAEWFKALVLKTRNRKVRGFESYSLRQLSVFGFLFSVITGGNLPFQVVELSNRTRMPTKIIICNRKPKIKTVLPGEMTELA
jgi:hypothetical protein